MSPWGRRLASRIPDGSRPQQQAPRRKSLLFELKECTSTKSLQRGKRAHAQAVQCGDHHSIYVATALVNMYAKCGSMVHARQVFDRIGQPTIVSWTALIMGYAENGEGSTALDLFARMKAQGCAPDSITFISALKACISLALQDESARGECLERGKQIHLEIGCSSELYVLNTLIDMYVKCGSVYHARQVFDSLKHPSLVSWNVLILGHAENGEASTALDLFTRMRSQGCEPNALTFVAAIKACTHLALEQDETGRTECLMQGKQIHSGIGCHLNSYVNSTLIEMYSKCGSMPDAREVFDNIRNPDVVAWTALILGYADNGEGATSLELFSRMRSQGYTPDCVTYVVALKACASLGALEFGRQIHADLDSRIERNAILVTSLVDFYAKCGSFREAQEVFDSHSSTRNLKTWNALLAGYSRLGANKAVFELFDRMQDEGNKPDVVTLLSILTCCSHAGLVKKANEVFVTMSAVYGVTPIAEHYNCMVDIFSRSNKLDDCIALLQSMPHRASDVTWMAVLSACHKWKNSGVGRLAFESLVDLDDGNATAYVLMAHIYGSRGMWEEQEMVLVMRNNSKAKNVSAQSCWTSELGEVHVLFAQAASPGSIATDPGDERQTFAVI